VEKADIQGKFSMVKHSELARIDKKRQKFSPSNNLTYTVIKTLSTIKGKCSAHHVDKEKFV